MIGDNRFCFIAPMYNASATLPDMLHSIFGQSYDNCHIILIDDVSQKEHVEVEKRYISLFEKMHPNKLTVIWNNEKKWEVANVLRGLMHCDDNDIVCRIDADDALCDLDALMIMNSVYKQTNCDAAWSMHRWGFSDRCISDKLPEGVDVYEYPWVTSHLKTFRKKLINDVPYENFTNMNGDLVKRCGDQAIYLPVLHRAKTKVFVPRVLYRYTIDEQEGAVYQTDDAKFQKREAEFIRSRGYVSSGESWMSSFMKH